ncbi:MAG TPA: SGNH/GDSL hydrolase family protein [Micromonosporaceae bacterium]|nr:SGNH/GDSL hydrolase family protein [Micromonosporaceae bacterium]
MQTGCAGTTEATDPYCLRAGEAAALLAGHPWRRFAVLGDSVAEGLYEPTEGYLELAWTDRVAVELARQQPELAYLNLAVSNLRAAQVRRTQLAPALQFRPDLALVACGGKDALHPAYDPDAVDRELAAMVSALREQGCAVMTMGSLECGPLPGLPEAIRFGGVDRLRLLGRRVAALSAALDTIHVDLTSHPAAGPDLLSRDGLHGNGRSHAIAAAEAVRRLGAHLGNSFDPRSPA